MATLLDDVRTFLLGRGLPAGSPDALLGGLHARREDAGFWRELRRLLGGLDDVRVSPRLVAGHELLGGAPLPAMLDALRAALPSERPSLGWVQRLPAAALAAFVVLGTACSEPSGGETGDTGDTGEELCYEASDYNVTQSPDVFCDLVELVNGASIGAGTRDALLDCLANLTATRRQQLLDQFSTMGDAELASALEDLAYSSECDYDPGH